MQPITPDWAALEDKLVRLANAHSRLAELIDEQRQAIRKADPEALAAVNVRIDAQLVDLIDVETARREVCRQLAGQLGLDVASAGTAKLATFCQRAGGRWTQRLRLAAEQLAEQFDRVAQAGRVNLSVARRLSEFCGELIGQVSRIGRDTGCYNAQGRRAVAREVIGANCFSTLG